MLEERKSRVHKLEEDNAKVWRTLENSITILNRMSMDSNNHVDGLVGLLLFDIGYHFIVVYEYIIFTTTLPRVRWETANT